MRLGSEILQRLQTGLIRLNSDIVLFCLFGPNLNSDAFM